MAKCDSQGFVVRLEQMGKLKDQDLIYVSVTDNLASCAKIDARTISKDGVVNLEAGKMLYNAANVPEDEFGCSKNKCANTGTFQGPVDTEGVGEGKEVIIGDFYKKMDGNLYLAGMVTAYILLPDGDHKVSLEITNYQEAAWANSNTINKIVHATKGNGGSALYPVVFDLADLSEVKGTGWTNGTVGTKLRVHIAGDNLEAKNLVGVSSFAFYESTEDLEINKVIVLGCIDTAGDSQDFDVIEGACSQSEYNSNSGSATASFSVNKWSKNFEYLNPTWHTTDETMFGIPHIVTRKVLEGTGDLAGYGYIQLSDMIDGDCGFTYIQTPGCANNSSELTRVSSPVPVELGPDKFQILSTSFNGTENMGTILVDPQWIGQELNVIYRQEREAEISQVTNEFRDFRVNIIVPFRMKNGEKVYHYYENAFMTTNAHNISRQDESARDVSFNVAADENGVRYKIVRPRD